MNKNQLIPILLSICLTLAVSLHPTEAHSTDQTLNKEAILAEANLENGKSIYTKGRQLDGPFVTFTGGPHWLRSQGGSCVTCHGEDGLGDLQPDLCFTTTPPITFKYLAGDGYPFASRQSGAHPAYTLRSLESVVETGFKPNGFEMDYCMPRWKFFSDNLRDLVGYLISLDEKE